MNNAFEQRAELTDDNCPICGYKYCFCEELATNLSVDASAASARTLPGLPRPEKDERFNASLIEAEVLIRAVGWRTLLHAHDHIWKDRGWDWRTRFDVTALLWGKAIDLCKEGMLRRAHRSSVVN